MSTWPNVVSIKRQASLGGLELISGVDQKEGSLDRPGLIHCVNPKLDSLGGPGLISGCDKKIRLLWMGLS